MSDSVRYRHNRAMRCAFRAIPLRESGEFTRAAQWSCVAAIHERRALALVPDGAEADRTRRILTESAEALEAQARAMGEEGGEE